MEETDLDKKGAYTAFCNSIVKIYKINGKINAVGEGSTTIKGTDSNGNSVTLTITVKPVATNPLVYLRSGKSAVLKAKNLNNKYATWRILSGENYIKGSVINGKITAASLQNNQEAGHSVISCEFKPDKDGKGFAYKYNVYIENPSLKADAYLKDAGKGKGYILEVKGNDSFSLKERYSGIAEDIVWKSSKPELAYIDEEGVIHTNDRNKIGTTVLSAKVNGVNLKVTLKVLATE
ncbi:MAG: hypothetical protein IJT16_10925 [Lachnospiraceae bacterium]|nr:hypothetical protein [Lachnospiraceae bacterium]